MEFSNIGKDKSDNSKYNFTNDQRKAIDNIIDFIAKDFNPAKYIVGLTGAGGTGKTFITKYIITHCKYSNSVIKCTSPTHKACRVFSQAIGGKDVDTIQSTFGLRLDLKLDDFDPKNPQLMRLLCFLLNLLLTFVRNVRSFLLKFCLLEMLISLLL